MAGLTRPILTLVAGGAAAQLVPLALGPLLTRLYTPQQFGQYALFAALAANLAVVACARYEQALPLARDESEARSLMALCLRLLLVTTAVSVPLAWWLGSRGTLVAWAWLPPAVAATAAVQWLTLWSVRAERFAALSAARIVQHGGGALAQAAAGTGAAARAFGGHGLIVGPVLASLATVWWLRRPAPASGWWSLWRVPRSAWLAAARTHRSFPLLNTPHAFSGALQDTVTVALLVWWSGEAAAGFWALALRYLKAPATLVGSAVSQVLYPRLAQSGPDDARRAVRQVMAVLMLLAMPLVLVLMLAGPALFAWLFGERWREAGELARALGPYIGMHFVASPLAVVTLAWNAQAWALRLALVGQIVFLAALLAGLQWGGLRGAAWAISAAMAVYFAWYFRSLATWQEIPDARLA